MTQHNKQTLFDMYILLETIQQIKWSTGWMAKLDSWTGKVSLLFDTKFIRALGTTKPPT